MSDKVRPFHFDVQPSKAHRKHMLVEVDSLTGEMTWGPPLEPNELVPITSQGWGIGLPPVSLTQFVILLLSEVASLRARVFALEAEKREHQP